MPCGVSCVAAMSRPGPWLRFGRDAGAGAVSQCRRGLRSVWRFSHSTDLSDLKWVKTINRCMSYTCHVYILYMIIHDHIRSYDVYDLYDAYEFRNSSDFESRNCWTSLNFSDFPCNFRAWGRAWPRALLSLQRRSIRSSFVLLKIQKKHCFSFFFLLPT